MAEVSRPDNPTANLGLKLFSLVVAVGLWLFVSVEREASVTVQVPVVISNLPPGIVVLGPPASPVSVRLTGPRIELERAKREGLRIVLDCSGVSGSSVAFNSLQKMLKLPIGVEATRVDPATVRLQLQSSSQGTEGR